MPPYLATAIAVAATLIAAWSAWRAHRFRTERDNQKTRGDSLLRDLNRSVDESSSQMESGERRFKELIEVVPVGICEVEVDGVIRRASARWGELCGVPPNTLRGRPWFDGLAEEDRPAIQLIWNRLAGANGTLDVEGRFIKPDGGVTWAAIRAIPQLDANGGLLGMNVAAMDITAGRDAESAKRILESRTIEAQKLESLGVLAGGIAHDFNNLLVGILGNASLLESILKPGSAESSLVAELDLAARRGADLANQMLAYSGKGRFVIEVIDPGVIARETLRLVAAGKGRERLMIDCAITESLPFIEADPTQVRQVLMNLLLNAIEAVGALQASVKVRVEPREIGVITDSADWLPSSPEPGKYVAISVADTGCGMDATTRKRMFEPFYTTKFTGRGLGLSAVLGIVRGHHGAISVESATGIGTTISVFFPQSTKPVPAVSRESPPGADESWVPARGTTVLVVDDEDLVRSLVSRTLTSAGMKTFMAASGNEALETFRLHLDEISLVVLDLTMPDLSGRVVVERMKKIRPEVQVLLMSGYDEGQARGGFGEQELAGFVQKPFRAAALVGAVRRALAAKVGH